MASGKKPEKVGVCDERYNFQPSINKKSA